MDHVQVPITQEDVEITWDEEAKPKSSPPPKPVKQKKPEPIKIGDRVRMSDFGKKHYPEDDPWNPHNDTGTVDVVPEGDEIESALEYGVSWDNSKGIGKTHNAYCGKELEKSEDQSPSKEKPQNKPDQKENKNEQQDQKPQQDQSTLREKWLSEAASRLTFLSPLGGMPKGVSGISCGYGKGGTRSSKGFSVHADSSGKNQVFIHPHLSDKDEVLDALVKALREAAPKMTYDHVASHLQGIASTMGPYPQHKLEENDPTQKKDGIRQLKCFCPVCGYTARTSRKWLDKSGAPFCPTYHKAADLKKIAQSPFTFIDTGGDVLYVKMAVDGDIAVDIETTPTV